ncbi:MAG: GxxExxY protein [Spirochaetota bacterium]
MKKESFATEDTESTEKKEESLFISSSVSSVTSVADSQIKQLTERIIGLAIEVHKQLGPGLLESAYETCLCWEFERAGIAYSRQVPLSLDYKGNTLDVAYRIDLVVGEKVLLELKSVEKLIPIHDAQILTYLKLSKLRIRLLMNFNALTLVQGLKRFVL